MKFIAALIFSLCLQQAFAAQEPLPLQRGSYQKIKSAHAGKPFIVAMWSVSCTHCGADLEIFQKLAQRNPEFNLVLISTDTPEVKSVIAERLNQYKLLDIAASQRAGKIESWVFADSYTERLHYEIDPQWYGELPRTYFFDASGNAKAISGVLNEAQVEAWLKGK